MATRKQSCFELKIEINNINKKTTIYSDCWKGYTGLSCVSYKHETVNYNKHFVDPVSGVHTNTIEGTWSGVKLNVPYRCRTKKLIDPFLVRYMIVKNERADPFRYIIDLIFK